MSAAPPKGRAPAVAFEDVSIVFGPRRKRALALADEGASRAEIARATGAVLGVHRASLEVAAGETLVLMGLSGSGKSTLLRAANGLSPVARGTVRLGAGPVADVGRARARAMRALRADRVAMVFQQFGLLPWRSVADNVGLGLELRGVPRAERMDRVEAQLGLVGLEGQGARPVHELSGGMQQRVGLARALATEAPILLMDEPFSALDPLIRTRLQDELVDLQAKLKRTILFVSHDLSEAVRIGDRIAILEEGRIVQVGTPREILAAPATPYVAEFVAHLNPAEVLTARDLVRPGHTRGPVIDIDAPFAEVVAMLGKADSVIVTEHRRAVGRIDRGAVMRALAPAEAPHEEAEPGI